MELPDEQLQQLARSYGIALDWWDWQGSHVVVPADTIVPVLAALGVDASHAARRRRDAWPIATATVAADAAGLRGQPGRAGSRRSTCTSPHGAAGAPWIDFEHGGVRHGLQQLENWKPARQVDGRLIGEATLPAARRSAARAITRCGRRSGDEERPRTLIITPPWVGFPASMGDRRAWGLATQLYSVRSAQSWGVGDLVDLADLAGLGGRRARRRLRAGQPAARGRAAGADGAVALPADQPALRQPDLPAGRTHPGVRRPRRRRAGRGRPSCGTTASAGSPASTRSTGTPPGPRNELRCNWSTGCRGRPAGRSPSGPTVAGRATGCATTRPGRRSPRQHGAGLARLAGGAAAPRARRRWRRSAVRAPPSRRIPPLAAVGARRAARRGPGGGDRGRRRDSASCTTSRSACIPAAPTPGACRTSSPQGVTVGAPPDAFNQNGQDWTQPPWRPDRLAEVAYQPFREPGGRPCCGTPAGSGSTTSSACSGCGGSRRDGCRPLAPTSATTTRR